MNLRPGSTVGMSHYLSSILKIIEMTMYMFQRFAPHDTAHLIQLMGGNVI